MGFNIGVDFGQIFPVHQGDATVLLVDQSALLHFNGQPILENHLPFYEPLTTRSGTVMVQKGSLRLTAFRDSAGRPVINPRRCRFIRPSIYLTLEEADTPFTDLTARIQRLHLQRGDFAENLNAMSDALLFLDASNELEEIFIRDLTSLITTNHFYTNLDSTQAAVKLTENAMRDHLFGFTREIPNTPPIIDSAGIKKNASNEPPKFEPR